MAQSAENLSDYYAHVRNYFKIEQQVIDNLTDDLKDNLPAILGPLRRPSTVIKKFLENNNASLEHDLIVKILGISPPYPYNSKKGKGFYQRILCADISGEIEVTVFNINKYSIGESIRIAGIMKETTEDGFERIKISRNGGIFSVPFVLPQTSLQQIIITPDNVSLTNIPSNFMTIKAIVFEKGSLISRKERNKGGSFSTLKIDCCAKKNKLPIYFQRQVAVDIAKQINKNELLLLTNVQLKINRGRIVCYASEYSSFQHKDVPNYSAPTDLEYIYLPYQNADLITLRNNFTGIGVVRGLLTHPCKIDGKYGQYYLFGFIDSSFSGFISVDKDNISLFPQTDEELTQVSIKGIIHSKNDYYKIIPTKCVISMDNRPLAPALISSQEINMIEGVFSTTGKVIDIYEPREFTTKDGKVDTYQRVRFDCGGQFLSMTGFNTKDKSKLFQLQLNNYYDIFFVRKEIYNNYLSLRMTNNTVFRLINDENDNDNESNSNYDSSYEDTESNYEDENMEYYQSQSKEDSDVLDEDFD